MSKHGGYNQTNRGHRRHSMAKVGATPVTGYRRVKSVGRAKDREYCPRCGQKRKACVCP